MLDYLEMLQLEDKYTKRPSMWEVALGFPHSRDVAARVAYDASISVKPYREAIGNDIVAQEFLKIDRDYKKLQDMKKFLRLTRPTLDAKTLDIPKARQCPIQSLYDFERVRSCGARIQCSCPFHKDKTPSMVIYTKQNTFHCFSCGKGGSVIDFVMQMQNIGFVDAVKQLNGGNV